MDSNLTVKTKLLTLLTIALPSAIPCAAYAQGSVVFENLGPGLNAPVYESDGVTPLSGSQFMAELLAAPSADNLTSIGAAVGFLTTPRAGYFNGGIRDINSVVPGDTAWIVVRVWNTGSGSTFAQAQASGLPDSWWESAVFTVVTGGRIIGGGPTPPAYLTGLGTSPVYLNVPEPSAFALAALGASVVLVRIWRKTPTLSKGGKPHARTMSPARDDRTAANTHRFFRS